MDSLMRGVAHQPDIPTFEQRYGLKAAALAVYRCTRASASWSA